MIGVSRELQRRYSINLAFLRYSYQNSVAPPLVFGHLFSAEYTPQTRIIDDASPEKKADAKFSAISLPLVSGLSLLPSHFSFFMRARTNIHGVKKRCSIVWLCEFNFARSYRWPGLRVRSELLFVAACFCSSCTVRCGTNVNLLHGCVNFTLFHGCCCS